MSIEFGDEVRFEYVGRLPDGTVFDTSHEIVAEQAGITEAKQEWEYTPVTAKSGNEQLLEGLEEGLVGLEKGDTETITVPPEKGYGEPRDDQIETYERRSFEQKLGDVESEEGVHIQTQEGETGEVVEVSSDTVDIDFNHPLADITLEFEVEILEVS